VHGKQGDRGMKLNRWLMAAAAGMAVVAVSGSLDAADARGRGAGARGLHAGGHVRAYTGHVFHGRVHRGHGHARRGVGVAVDVPLAYGVYSSGYYGGGSCRSLRMRAEATGRAYWWARYQACLDGYDD
jgi:hypothetical protein